MGADGQPDRIITCCFCGARSLIGRDQRRLRLVCHGCGAPIARIEAVSAPNRRRTERPGKKPAVPHRAERPREHLPKDRPARRRKGRRRFSFSRWIEEIADEVEDAIEDLFD